MGCSRSIILEFIIQTRTFSKVKGNTIPLFRVQHGETRTVLGKHGYSFAIRSSIFQVLPCLPSFPSFVYHTGFLFISVNTSTSKPILVQGPNTYFHSVSFTPSLLAWLTNCFQWWSRLASYSVTFPLSSFLTTP